ncbi:MAG: ATP-binding protein [Rubrivivax sp.]
MGWLNSLQVKVLLAYVAGAVLSIALLVLAAVLIKASQGDALSGADVANTAQGMAGELRFDANGVPVGFDTSDFDFEWVFESMKQEIAYRVLDTGGKVVLSSAAGPGFWPQQGAALLLQRQRFEFEHQGIPVRAATEPVEHGGRTWYVQFAASTRFQELMYRAFALPFTRDSITVFSIVLLFVFGACVYVTLRVALKPLRRISESAAAISPHSLHARLQTAAVPAEIAPLVHSFNRALERLEQGYRVQQEFLATAAHELKTPLALIRAQVELGEPSAQRGELLQDVEHMTRQVQQLLHLAEASEVQNYQPTLVDMHAVVAEAAAYLQRMAGAADVRLDLPAGTVAMHWQADRGALFTLLKNLLENAIQHTPPGTLVRVEVDATAVSVRDWGRSVPQDQLATIFVRFWRGPHRRDKGAGLGLAICQEIARAHGWTLAAHRAEPGLRVVLQRNDEGRRNAPR